MTGPLPWVYSDTHLLAVHKPAGLLVHRTALDAHAAADVLSLLRAQVGAPLWPVHRLDKGTSGVLLLARDAASARSLGAAFARSGDPTVAAALPGTPANAPADALANTLASAPANTLASALAIAPPASPPGQVIKHYLALVRGWPAAAGQIDQPLARDPELPSAGQPQLAASTRWQVLARLSLPLATQAQHADTRLALVLVQPLSGRRHQIRRHFKQLAHPLIGDATHGKGPLNRSIAANTGQARLWLHALQLSVPHPADGRAITLRAEPGPEWARWLGPAGPPGPEGA